MAFRLKLVPEKTDWDFFQYQWITFGASIVAMLGSLVVLLVMGLNFGIDFKGGTTLRVETSQPINVGSLREGMAALSLGDVTISEVFDPAFGPDKHVAMIRVEAAEGAEAMSEAGVAQIAGALKAVDSALVIASVESVGPKVSGELVWTAVLSVLAATAGISAYVWLRFEWQYALGAMVALFHDVFLTIGIFSLFQLKFDLTIIAALLTTLGYSINDTVVVFDRLRENLMKYKTMALRDVMNLSVNETLSRTLMTAGSTLLALVALLIWGGDVIRGFTFAITWGVLVGTYSSIYVAKNIVLFLGLDRNKVSGLGEAKAADAAFFTEDPSKQAKGKS